MGPGLERTCARFVKGVAMYLTGFADEAGSDLAVQIKALKELGWKNLESRNIGDKNLTLISDGEFDRVCESVAAAGIRINCFGSGVANWAKKLSDSPQSSYDEMKRAVPRMRRLGTRMIRIMSFELPGPVPLSDKDTEREALKRLREIVKIAEGGGVICVHENCNGWAGQSWEHTLRMLDAIPSPSLKLVFDTGNPFHEKDVRGPEPYGWQDSHEFYRHVKDHLIYVHVKDGRRDGEKTTHTFPGEGTCQVRETLTDLFRRGYDGGISIEPHLAVQAHDPSITSEPEIRYTSFVEYGRRLEKMVREIGWTDIG
jgi:sugar phosphate isomerase/epimerase